MNKMIAYCGLVCDSCPIYLATLETNASQQQKMRKSIARTCTEHYGMNLRPEDVTNCDGCRTNTGRLFSGCRNCEIRKCAGLKDVETCARCPEYVCNTLKEFFRLDPCAQKRLDDIWKSYSV